MTDSDKKTCVQRGCEGETKRERICRLNDKFRRGGPTRREFVLTAGVLALGIRAIGEMYSEVCQFDDFSTDNDPYDEHDFGAFAHDGQRLFWKIDYYDISRSSGSPDPSDPEVTKRVLTIMLASEY